jgi:hypothetical protein
MMMLAVVARDWWGMWERETCDSGGLGWWCVGAPEGERNEEGGGPTWMGSALRRETTGGVALEKLLWGFSEKSCHADFKV